MQDLFLFISFVKVGNGAASSRTAGGVGKEETAD